MYLMKLCIAFLCYLSFPLFSFTTKQPELRISFVKASEERRNHERLVRAEEEKRLKEQKKRMYERCDELENVIEKRKQEIAQQKNEVTRLFSGEEEYSPSSLVSQREATAEQLRHISAQVTRAVEEALLLNRRFQAVLDREPEIACNDSSECSYTWHDLKKKEYQAEVLEAQCVNLSHKKILEYHQKEYFSEQWEQRVKRRCRLYAAVEAKTQKLGDVREREQQTYLLALLHLLQREEEECDELMYEWHSYRIYLADTECQLSEYEHAEKRNAIAFIQQHLDFSLKDTECAFKDYQQQKKRAQEKGKKYAYELTSIRRKKRYLAKALADASDASFLFPLHKRLLLKRALIYAHHKELIIMYKRDLEESLVKSKALKASCFFLVYKHSEGRNDCEITEKIDGWFLQFLHHFRAIKRFLTQLRHKRVVLTLALFHARLQQSVLAHQEKEAGVKAPLVLHALVRAQLHTTHTLLGLQKQIEDAYESMKTDVYEMLKSLQKERRNVRIWQRDPQALHWDDLVQIKKDLQVVGIYVTRTLPRLLFSPSRWVRWAVQQPIQRVIGVFLLFCALGVFLLLIRRFLYYLFLLSHKNIPGRKEKIRVFLSSFLYRSSNVIGVWLYSAVAVFFLARYEGRLAFPLSLPFFYFKFLFYLFTSFVWGLLLYRFFVQAMKSGKRSVMVSRFLPLCVTVLGLGAVLLPLQRALFYLPLHVINPDYSLLPHIVRQGAGLLVVLVAFFFFFAHKQAVLDLLPKKATDDRVLTRWMAGGYYPFILFWSILLVLVNPLVGYGTLALYIMVCTLLTLPVIAGAWWFHTSLCRLLLWICTTQKKSGEKASRYDRFAYAKVYYGIGIVLHFIGMALVVCEIMLSIWGIDYSIKDLWYRLSQEWVIAVGEEEKVGIIDVLKLGAFILFGFILSSSFFRVIWLRLFKSFQINRDTQKTIFRRTHYVIVGLAVLVGLYVVKLNTVVSYAVTTFLKSKLIV